jgi:hypothetical protein
MEGKSFKGRQKLKICLFRLGGSFFSSSFTEIGVLLFWWMVFEMEIGRKQSNYLFIFFGICLKCLLFEVASWGKKVVIARQQTTS